ncbi:Alpha/Beta hydrolase fold [Arabidopsis thaliana x Arabidopsis arenosa]|uniref:Methylesterase n=1 Tax=Arabidopsis thaliana x Arabidopsis arenosa TaxID=1240361 RepID=A0A8T1YCU1_9BRAS|nr:Alpha/Beta hydrolase fold [Arabidopsis thaliana x Arabidopsis arenosa]
MGGESGEDDPIIHFVFVHGASHGAWCWYKIITLLDAAGFKSSTVDLTGAGISLTDSNTVFHSDQYNRPLFSLLSDLPPFHKVILVGHSIGGASVTEALCKFTDKISMAIYITASMVKPGSISSPDLLNILEGEEEIHDYTFGEGTDKPPTGYIIKEEFRRHYYYNQSPLEDITLSSKLLRPAPMRAFQELDKLPPNPKAENVPRVYIKTAKDNIIDPMRQDQMVENWPVFQMYVLEESDHSPFFSVPTTLFAYLLHAVSSLHR